MHALPGVWVGVGVVVRVCRGGGVGGGWRGGAWRGVAGRGVTPRSVPPMGTLPRLGPCWDALAASPISEISAPLPHPLPLATLATYRTTKVWLTQLVKQVMHIRCYFAQYNTVMSLVILYPPNQEVLRHTRCGHVAAWWIAAVDDKYVNYDVWLTLCHKNSQNSIALQSQVARENVNLLPMRRACGTEGENCMSHQRTCALAS